LLNNFSQKSEKLLYLKSQYVLLKADLMTKVFKNI